jgi:hypothetical protein
MTTYFPCPGSSLRSWPPVRRRTRRRRGTGRGWEGGRGADLPLGPRFLLGTHGECSERRATRLPRLVTPLPSSASRPASPVWSGWPTRRRIRHGLASARKANPPPAPYAGAIRFEPESRRRASRHESDGPSAIVVGLQGIERHRPPFPLRALGLADARGPHRSCRRRWLLHSGHCDQRGLERRISRWARACP